MNAANQPPRASLLKWMVLSAVVLGAFAVVASFAPPRLRLLVLFSIAYGILSGFTLGWLAHRCAVSCRLTVAGVSGLLIAAAFAGTSLLSWRLQSAELRSLHEANPQIPIPADPEAKAKWEAETSASRERVLDERTRFPAFLQRRLAQWGTWPAPWPAVLWACEIALAGIAGGFAAARASRNCNAAPPDANL